VSITSVASVASGAPPASVLWARHVDGLSLQQVVFEPLPGDLRPPFVGDDVVGLVQR
jgi:hypothetical protein